MGFRIATNVTSMNAQRNLEKNSEKLQESLNRLSSGQRINQAKDDSAGLGISEKLRATIRSLGQARRNSNDGISLVQTAEGAMAEVSNNLIRLRELSVQAASDTVGQDERHFADIETQQLKTEIERIAQSTEFNGTKLLGGVGTPMSIQIGTLNREGLDQIEFNPEANNLTLEALGLTEVGTTSKEFALSNLAVLDNAMIRLNGQRANLGALQNRLQSVVNSIDIYNENLGQTYSNIRDTDIAGETVELTKRSILNSAGTAVLAQANAMPKQALQLLS